VKEEKKRGASFKKLNRERRHGGGAGVNAAAAAAEAAKATALAPMGKGPPFVCGSCRRQERQWRPR